MKKILSHITILTVLPAFLVFASGVSLVKHTCQKSETTSYSFFEEVSCCGQNSHCDITSSIPAKSSCCDIPEINDHVLYGEECCSSDTFLLVLDETFVSQSPIVNIHEEIVPQIEAVGFFSLYDGPLTKNILLHSNDPPLLTGISFLIFTHQLKIACLV